jgi:microcystin-dependent protein
MARLREWGDDISGTIVTTGIATAYTLSTSQGFDSLAHLNGAMIAFVPHTTNGATVTLNVDGLGAKPLRSSPGAELGAGVLVQGTPYVATYNNADGAFYLQGFVGNPFNLPVSGSIDYFGSTAPNSSFVFLSGQAISRTVYSVLFGLIGTNWGVGDGTTTFNLPDLRDRFTCGKGDMNGTPANRITAAGGNYDTTAAGAAGGAQNKTLANGNLPASIPYSDPTHVHAAGPSSEFSGGATANFTAGAATPPAITAPHQFSSITTGIASIGIVINPGSGNTPVAIVPPSVACGKIMRII